MKELRFGRWSLWLVGIGLLFAAPLPVQASKTSDVLRRFVVGYKTPKAKLYRILWKSRLSAKDLQYHSHETTRYLRNAIFALKGARFFSPELQVFFRKQRWYRPRRSTRQVRLNRTARRNLLFLRKLEARLIAKRKKELLNKLWGEKPFAVMVYGPKTCVRYGAYQVVQNDTFVRVAQARPGNPCVIRKADIVLTISRSKDFEMKGEFHGLAGKYIFLWGLGSSDMQDLVVVSLATKKKVLVRKQMDPVAQIRFNRSTQQLSFFQGVKTSRSCKLKSSTVGNMPLYRLLLKACWKTLVKKEPYLKGLKPPVCRCGGGLGPYLAARFAWSVKKPNAKPVFVGKLKCGCSS